MPSIILKTKLYIPPLRPEAVPRPRLLRRLDDGLTCKLTLISAPAGFGKTTLLSAWVREMRAAWVSLDEGDNDLTRFLSYLVAALEALQPGAGAAALTMLRSPKPPMESVLTALINDIIDIQAPFIFVLDDYHTISAKPVHDAMVFLLDHLPPPGDSGAPRQAMHLVIATRADPPLPLARLRAHGHLNELRAADLRFAPDEVAELLNRAIGPGLAAEDVAALAARTEGWVAGLQMAAISMQGQDPAHMADFIRAFTGSNRYVLDYLAEEVFQRQPESLQTFLLQTSTLDRLSGPLCDAVCDAAPHESQATLEHMERTNLFIVPLDDQRRWYRYHRLFADLLRQRLHRLYPAQVPVLHRRASLWYERNDSVAPAIEHALSAGDFERAAGLIDGHAEMLWGHGYQATLLKWLDALPGDMLEVRPGLCIYYAMMLFVAGHLDRAEAYLRAAEQSALSGEHRGMIAATRAFIAMYQGDVASIIRFAQQALAQLPERSVVWRSNAAVVLGDAYSLSGDLEAAVQAQTEALAVSKTIGNTDLLLLAAVKLCMLLLAQGRLRQVAELCYQYLEVAGARGFAQTVRAGELSSILASILYEWNQIDEATQYARRGLALAKRGDNISALGLSYLVLGRVLLAAGDMAGAVQTLHDLDVMVEHADLPSWLVGGNAAWRAQIWGIQGRFDDALQLFESFGVGADDDFSYARQDFYLALAGLLVDQGDPDKALRLLARLLAVVEGAGAVGRLVRVLTLQGLALQAQGHETEALAALGRALDLAEPGGYARVFIDGGDARPLLRKAAAHGNAYARKVLGAVGESEPSASAPEQPPIDPLSARELEILRLLNTHLSSAEIAGELVISVNTVRTHIKNIYSKLGVHGRTEAVEQAEALDLL
ncbi:MAG: hypothetical protein JXB47_00455 [Anaerolineae bacterium]|nr:hypothetical protein [Anaerolineae bacterium]